MTERERVGALAANVPLLANKHYAAPSVLTPENLLREARRQKRLPVGPVPPIVVLDPDGDLVDHLSISGRARRHPTWACYHTELVEIELQGTAIGLIGRAVGAPFAVLVAEELFAAGCELLISLTSAGQILPLGEPPYVVLIERALRDEGTSYHYLPPAPYSTLAAALRALVIAGWQAPALPLHVGVSWTTDAPFRETEPAIEQARVSGIVAVEMEAAALYALATARELAIICFAHVTNQLAQSEGDFEKGEANGSTTALTLIEQVARAWHSRPSAR